MIAIDANIIVRFLANDDRRQGHRARALIEVEDAFIPTSVLLESEWVLRSAYKLSRRNVFEKLGAFLNLPRVVVQDRAVAFSRRRRGRSGRWRCARHSREGVPGETP